MLPGPVSRGPAAPQPPAPTWLVVLAMVVMLVAAPAADATNGSVCTNTTAGNGSAPTSGNTNLNTSAPCAVDTPPPPPFVVVLAMNVTVNLNGSGVAQTAVIDGCSLVPYPLWTRAQATATMNNGSVVCTTSLKEAVRLVPAGGHVVPTPVNVSRLPASATIHPDDPVAAHPNRVDILPSATVRIQKPMRLLCGGPLGTCIVDCRYRFGPALLLAVSAGTTDDYVQVDDMLFARCIQVNSGGALEMHGGSAIFTRCAFVDNMAALGGAMSVSVGYVLLGGCFFIGNTVNTAGGAVFLNSGSGSFQGCYFLRNGGGMEHWGGGAIMAYNQAALSTRECVFEENDGGSSDTTYGGGAVALALQSASAVATSVFTGNECTQGGAIGISSTSTVDVTRSYFSNNTALVTGGAVYSRDTSVMRTCSECLFWKNVAESAGAVHADLSQQTGGAAWTITGSAFVANVAKRSGSSAIDSYTPTADTLTLSDTLVMDNIAARDAPVDSIYATNGGAVRVSGPVRVEHCMFVRNTAIHDGVSGGGLGAALDTSVVNCGFVGNSAHAGGGLAMSLTYGYSVSNLSFVGNIATHRGGAFVQLPTNNLDVLRTLVTITNLWADGNVVRPRSGSTGSLAAYQLGTGGAIGLDWASVTLRGIVVQNSEASSDGGAVEATDVALAMSSCVLRNNVARQGGGGVSLSTTSFAATSANITACVLTNNTAGAGGGGMALDIPMVMVSEVDLIENFAAGPGGGVLKSARTHLAAGSSRFIGNAALTDGGGLYSSTTAATATAEGSVASLSSLSLANCSFHGNAAAGTGGGLAVEATAAVTAVETAGLQALLQQLPRFQRCTWGGDNMARRGAAAILHLGSGGRCVTSSLQLQLNAGLPHSAAATTLHVSNAGALASEFLGRLSENSTLLPTGTNVTVSQAAQTARSATGYTLATLPTVCNASASLQVPGAGSWRGWLATVAPATGARCLPPVASTAVQLEWQNISAHDLTSQGQLTEVTVPPGHHLPGDVGVRVLDAFSHPVTWAQTPIEVVAVVRVGVPTSANNTALTTAGGAAQATSPRLQGSTAAFPDERGAVVFAVEVLAAPGRYELQAWSPQLEAPPAATVLTARTCHLGEGKQANGVSCEPCSAGRYNDVRSYSYCKACPMGTAAGETGTVVCTPCAAGSYSSSAAMKECTPVPLGTFANTTGATKPVPCPPGRFADGTGRLLCSECGRGAVATPAREACTLCPAGSFRANGTTCLPCPVGAVSEPGSLECVVCSAGTHSSAGARECVECPAETFSFSGAEECTPCPSCTGQRCNNFGGATICRDGLIDLRGFYWTSPLASKLDAMTSVQVPRVVYRCASTDACPGVNSSSLLPECGAGYTGTLCKQCASGYSLQLGDTCTPCDESTAVSVAVLAALCISGCICVLFVIKYKEVLPVQSFKVLSTFLQIIAAGEASYSLSWPDPFATFVRSTRVFLLQIISVVRPGCASEANYYLTLVTTLVGFKLCTLATVIYTFVWLALRRVRRGTSPTYRHAFGHVRWWHVSRNAFLFLLFAFAGVSYTTMRVFQCQEVDGRPMLLADVSVQCYTTQWWGFAVYSIVMLALYTCGLPIIITWTLCRKRKELHQAATFKRLGYLYRCYGVTAPYWQVEELLRRLAIVVVGIYVSPGSATQMLCAILICGYAHVAHAAFKPFTDRSIYLLQHLCLATTFFYFVIGLLMKIDGLDHHHPLHIGLSWALSAMVAVVLLAGLALMARNTYANVRNKVRFTGRETAMQRGLNRGNSNRRLRVHLRNLLAGTRFSSSRRHTRRGDTGREFGGPGDGEDADLRDALKRKRAKNLTLKHSKSGPSDARLKSKSAGPVPASVELAGRHVPPPSSAGADSPHLALVDHDSAVKPTESLRDPVHRTPFTHNPLRATAHRPRPAARAAGDDTDAADDADDDTGAGAGAGSESAAHAGVLPRGRGSHDSHRGHTSSTAQALQLPPPASTPGSPGLSSRSTSTSTGGRRPGRQGRQGPSRRVRGRARRQTARSGAMQHRSAFAPDRARPHERAPGTRGRDG